MRFDRGFGSGASDEALVLSAPSRVPEESNLSIASDPSAPARIVLDLCPRVPRVGYPARASCPRGRARSHSTAVPGKAILVAASAAAAAGTWLANTGACGGRSLTQS